MFPMSEASEASDAPPASSMQSDFFSALQDIEFTDNGIPADVDDSFDDHIGGNSRLNLPPCPLCQQPATPQIGGFGANTNGNKRWWECITCMSRVTGRKFQWTENKPSLQAELRLKGQVDVRDCMERYPRNLVQPYKCSRCGLPAKGHTCLNPKKRKSIMEKSDVDTDGFALACDNDKNGSSANDAAHDDTALNTENHVHVNSRTNKHATPSSNSKDNPFNSSDFEKVNLEPHILGNSVISTPVSAKFAESLLSMNSSFTCCYQPNATLDEWYLSTGFLRNPRYGYSSKDAANAYVYKIRKSNESVAGWTHGNLCDCAYKHNTDEHRYMCSVCKLCTSTISSVAACSICIDTKGEREALKCSKNCGEKNHIHVCQSCLDDKIDWYECNTCGKSVHDCCTKNFPSHYMDSDLPFMCEVCICDKLYTNGHGVYDVCNGKIPFDSTTFQSAILVADLDNTNNTIITMTFFKDTVQSFTTLDAAINFVKQNDCHAITFSPSQQCLDSVFT
jgi:hypothetical protein